MAYLKEKLNVSILMKNVRSNIYIYITLHFIGGIMSFVDF